MTENVFHHPGVIATLPDVQTAQYNRLAHEAEVDSLVFLNQYCKPESGWLSPLVETLETDDRVGAAGAKVLFPDGSVCQAGMLTLDFFTLPDPFVVVPAFYGKPGSHTSVNKKRRCRALGSYCLAVRKDVFIKIGGFDEQMPLDIAVIDLCLKIQAAGLETVYQPESCVFLQDEGDYTDKHFSVEPVSPLLTRKWVLQPDARIVCDAQRKTILFQLDPLPYDRQKARTIKQPLFLDKSWVIYQVAARSFKTMDFETARQWLLLLSKRNRDEAYSPQLWDQWLEDMDEPDVVLYRGASFFKQMGDYDISEKWFRRLYDTPDIGGLLAGVCFHLGEIEFNKKDNRKAKEYFKRCLELNKNHGKARYYLERIGQ